MGGRVFARKVKQDYPTLSAKMTGLFEIWNKIKSTIMINFELESKEISTGIKNAEDYFGCEHVIINNIKKQLVAGVEINTVAGFLKKLQNYMEDNAVKNTGEDANTNFKYATGILKTLNTTPYWQSWIKATA